MTSGASIRYTTDGSTPSDTLGTVYAGPISVSASMTIRAVAYLSGWTSSSVSDGTYTITPQVAVSVSGGTGFTVALDRDGTVWAWGNGNYGQLGDGTTDQRLTPVQVSGLTGVAAVEAGFAHAVAVKAAGPRRRGGLGRAASSATGRRTRLTPVRCRG
jgi:hypothetical protein